MTFAAFPAWVSWIAIAAAIGAGIWLFLLKVRPPRIAVPSMTLWRRVLDEARDVTLWERIRKAVSLAIAIAITLALALAFMRPSRSTTASASAVRGAGGGRLLVVLDSSWSMQAKTRNGETRWDRAVAEARRLALAAGGNDVAFATTADGLIEGPTNDVALLESALDRTSPATTDTVAWPQIAGVETVHFITDGEVLRPLAPDVIVHSVFEPAPNVAITSFDVHESSQIDRAGDAYLEIANYAAAPQSVHLLLTRGRDPIVDKKIDFAAGEAVRQMVSLPIGGDAVLHAHIESVGNALTVDDDATALIRGATPVEVAVVSDQPAAIRTLFASDPLVHPTFVAPTAYRSGNEDVVIFDRWAPAQSPSKPALYFAPSSTSWLGLSQSTEDHPRWTKAGGHAVLNGVDPLTFTIDRAHRYKGAALVPIAQSDNGTPILYSVRQNPRALLATFTLTESKLPAAVGFPVLIGNAIDWLAHPPVDRVHGPGRAVFGADTTRVVNSEGEEIALMRIGNSAFAMLLKPGLYRSESGGGRTAFAVNAADPQASNLMRTSLASSAGKTEAGRSARPWWLYFAALALALLGAEWWTWQRRVTI